MELNDYPQAIAKLQRELLELDQQIIGLTESVTIFLAEIDKQIAFDQTLKNDAQRKVKRIEMQQADPDYYTASRQLKETQEKRALLDIDLQRLRNEFSVLKLERREAIASMELHASTAA
jgi:hypothetical protein